MNNNTSTSHFEYTLSINQKEILEMGLPDKGFDLIDYHILAFLGKMNGWNNNTKEYDGHTYHWISHTLVNKALPLIQISWRTWMRRVQKYIEQGFMQRHPENGLTGGKAYYFITDKTKKLLPAGGQKSSDTPMPPMTYPYATDDIPPMSPVTYPPMSRMAYNQYTNRTVNKRTDTPLTPQGGNLGDKGETARKNSELVTQAIEYFNKVSGAKVMSSAQGRRDVTRKCLKKIKYDLSVWEKTVDWFVKRKREEFAAYASRDYSTDYTTFTRPGNFPRYVDSSMEEEHKLPEVQVHGNCKVVMIDGIRYETRDNFKTWLKYDKDTGAREQCSLPVLEQISQQQMQTS